MFDKFRLKRELKKKQKLTKDDFVSTTIYANFGDKLHNMKVDKQNVFDEVYQETKEELLPLEKADLIDFWNKEGHGRTDKKR